MAEMANTHSGDARKVAVARRRAQSQTGKTATSGGTSASTVIKQPSKAAMPVVSSNQGAARSASRARRQAMSTSGKAGIVSQDRTRVVASTPPPAAAIKTDTQQSKRDCGCGCKGERDKRDQLSVAKAGGNGATLRPAPKLKLAGSTARAASVARRQAMSTRGKAGLNGKGMSTAASARAANPTVSSRELAQALREQRSRNGKAGEKKSEPCGRSRPNKQTKNTAAQDAPWKVGASETSHGQTVTGTMVGRSESVTGDEPSTCRPVTGTEYMGADIFRKFCQIDAGKQPRKVSVSPTSRGNRVSGTELGRSAKVTGDEPGTCKRVTGNEYVGAMQSEIFCGTKAEKSPAKIISSETRKGKTVTGNNVGRSSKLTGDESGANRELTGTQYMQRGNGKAPEKVGNSATLRGGAVTGTMVGRSELVTGDEPGSCRNVTGDDYIGQEQYSGFCKTAPKPTDRKVGQSQTLKGKEVTGTMTGRGERVTGDESGTCKAVTGTPYAGAEQYQSYCKSDDAGLAAARARRQRATPGAVMTGLQPGIGGKLTGAHKGACEPLTGTQYVGADQFSQVCPASPAEPGSPDFPQPIGGTPWGKFSVESPNHAAQTDEVHAGVTGTQYEQGYITGPFGKATGKVTGTEEARFGRGNGNSVPTLPETSEMIEGRVKSRVTGEGMDAGLRVTGDDWGRGDVVTGTEGTSARRRNPTRRGATAGMAMQTQVIKRNEELPVPTSKVTGGSGNTERGALITYSGGARG
jgi:hypothetical protein